MVEYELRHSSISQILSQHSVDPAALLCRNDYFSCLPVMLNLVFVVIFLCRCEIVRQQIYSQRFEASMLLDSSAPIGKGSFFTYAFFIPRHDIPHPLVLAECSLVVANFPSGNFIEDDILAVLLEFPIHSLLCSVVFLQYIH